MGQKLLASVCINILAIYFLITIVFDLSFSYGVLFVLLTLSALYLLYINLFLIRNNYNKRTFFYLASGIELLKYFLVILSVTVLINLSWLIYIITVSNSSLRLFIINLLLVAIGNGIIFWNGITRVYLSSVQLGINKRILGIILGWIFPINIFYLRKIINICSRELSLEITKDNLNNSRKIHKICDTRYPILLVHGVFFRDLRYFNYWGRIPNELERNGATIFYANQQSAETVDTCGMEIADKIEEIIALGYEKVNIIAHSKGGLDSRVAISKYDVGKYVATLTTINTPHQGCIFAEYLLNSLPKGVQNKMAKTYNATLKKLGDTSPDFIAAAADLCNTTCLKRNEEILDNPNVLYESIMSHCKSATSGRFPLNLSHSFVKKMDGQNDGLVGVDSAKWGSSFTLVEPKGNRGISHGDMIDLNRENIEGFDVREFYVELVSNLKKRGY